MRDFIILVLFVWLFCAWIFLYALDKKIKSFESRVQKIEQLVPISFKIEK